MPGPDDYSVAQGVSTVEPGGVDEGVTDILIATLDETTPFLPLTLPDPCGPIARLLQSAFCGIVGC